MRIVLRDDVAGLGKRGDIVDVARGFARNFLFPAGRAIQATAGVASQASSMRRARDERDVRDRQSAEALAARLSGVTVVVPARAATGGRLFGSVTSAEIARAVETQTGTAVDRRQVHLDEPLKSVGSHVVPVRLHGEISVDVTVDVVAS